MTMASTSAARSHSSTRVTLAPRHVSPLSPRLSHPCDPHSSHHYHPYHSPRGITTSRQPVRRQEPRAIVYAAMYSTLQQRWNKQAEDLAAHGEFSRIVRQKRSRDPDEDDEEQQQGRSESARVVDSRSRSVSPVNECVVESNKRMRRASSAPILTPCPRRRRGSNIEVRTTFQDNDDESNFQGGYRLVRSLSARENGRSDRAEALLRVVRSFEHVLACRADGWRMLEAAT